VSAPGTFEETRGRLESELREVNAELNDLKGQKTAAERSLEESENLLEEGICPTCEREIEDESHLDIEDQQSHVDELNDHISELTQKKTELEDELEVVEQRCEDAETPVRTNSHWKIRSGQ